MFTLDIHQHLLDISQVKHGPLTVSPDSVNPEDFEWAVKKYMEKTRIATQRNPEGFIWRLKSWSWINHNTSIQTASEWAWNQFMQNTPEMPKIWQTRETSLEAIPKMPKVWQIRWASLESIPKISNVTTNNPFPRRWEMSSNIQIDPNARVWTIASEGGWKIWIGPGARVWDVTSSWTWASVRIGTSD